MRARFERHVGCRAFRPRAGSFQRDDFCVRAAGAFVPAFTDDFAVAHEDATHTRVGRRRVEAAPGKLERACHVFAVGFGEHRDAAKSEKSFNTKATKDTK
jgi:hypothetical protein